MPARRLAFFFKARPMSGFEMKTKITPSLFVRFRATPLNVRQSLSGGALRPDRRFAPFGELSDRHLAAVGK